jgi:hypothetical protein
MSEAGTRYVDALAAKDTDTLRDLFASDVVFRGMTPGRFWAAESPDHVLTILNQWFEPSDVIEGVEHVEVGAMVDRGRVDYRFRIRNSDGLFAAEQRGYYDLNDDGRIARMHVMCSGFRSIEGAPSA